MSKTIKNTFDNKLSFQNLLKAHERARKGKVYKASVIRFEMDLENNLINLYDELKKESYQLGKYREFMIKEPKERVIKALPYKDRIVHQWYIYEFIKPYMYPRFVKDTFACIEGRGTHLAAIRLQQYMRRMRSQYQNYYIVKFDIHKFFYSIDKSILYAKMQKYIKDPKLLRLTYRFIYDNDEPFGIPIGNYTSQYFANIYLHEMDLFIKHELKIKYYVRYMDDFIMLVPTKKDAHQMMKIVKEYVALQLNLSLNEKSRYFPNKMGVEFCGYQIYEDYRKLKKRSKNKMKVQIKKWNWEYHHDKLNCAKMTLSWKSWIGHVKHADTYLLQNKYYDMLPCKIATKW